MKTVINKQNLVSVIIPIYKVEEYIEKCINSVLNQTYTNLEVILVEDGSPDSCGKICDQFQQKDARVQVIHKKNGGLSEARNEGIEASHGDYLMFVDGDDWIDLDLIEILLELCVDYDAEIAECQYREFFSKTRSKQLKNTEEIVVMNNIEALKGMLDWTYFKPVAWGKLYSKSIIGDIRFPLDKVNEDEFTTYKYIYNAKKLVHIDIAKYNYNRMRNDSITAKYSIRNLDACEAFLERRDFFRKHDLQVLEEKMNNAYCIVLLDTLYKCYKNKLGGERVNKLLRQVEADIIYFENRPIDIYFVNEFEIVANSLQKYGLHRDKMELEHQEIDSESPLEKSYEELLAENQQLKARVESLLNSRTWRCVGGIKKIFGVEYATEKVRRWKREKRNAKEVALISNQTAPQSNQEKFEFNYEHLLTGFEYKFYKYKSERDALYPLDITNVHFHYVKGLVSVVFPVFNGDDYIILSIESVLAQTYTNFELIIINDGSTDTTPQILDEYAKRDARIRVIHQSNIRLPKTLSKGFRMARGEFLTWTSADNIMHEDFLASFVKELECNPRIGMVWGNMRLIDEKGDPISSNRWYANAEYPEEVMFPRSVLELNTIANNYIGAAFMYRAICAHMVLDYSAFKFCTEDYDYWMKINELCVMRHTQFEDTLYSYRIHPNSLTSKDKELKITENRYKLMLLDDFRRDYYLKPLVWLFVGDVENNTWYKSIRVCIEKAGHKIVTFDEAKKLTCNLYERIVVVSLNSESSSNSEFETLNAYKVLITNDDSVSTKNWDCCIKSEYKYPVRHLENYKGWYSFTNHESAFSFIDAKAKTKFLYDLEEKMDCTTENVDLISVIICYSGQVEVLKESLCSIKEQSEEVEVVLLVDISLTYQEEQEISTVYPGLKIIRNVSENLVTRVNSGIWQCSGNILVFGQDDYIFEGGYFEELRKDMSKEQVKIVCGSVKNMRGVTEEQRIVSREHRFYSDGLLDDLKFCYASNISVKREEMLLIGGLYHLSPEVRDTCITVALFGMLQIIHNMRLKAVFKNRHCSVYSQNEKSYGDLTLLKKSEVLGLYNLETQLIMPYDTYPEEVKRNKENWSDEVLIFLLEKIRRDFTNKSQIDWIKRWYTGIKMPQISIIVSIYDTETELKRCVDSIINQTLKNIEIILIDDGSKDDSGKICDYYAENDDRIKVIHKKNSGLFEVRNRGIDVASAPYLMFVDSDDWIDSDMCEVLYEVAQQNQADIVECSYRTVYPDHNEEESSNTGEIIVGDSIFALQSKLKWKNFKPIAGCKLYHQKIFADGNRFTQNTYCEDKIFSHELFFATQKLVYIDISKYNCCCGSSDSIKSNIIENILDSCYTLRSRVDFVIQNELLDIEKQVKEMYCWVLFNRLFRCHCMHVAEERLNGLLEDVRKDKVNVLSWDISEDYKTNYKILLRSYELFCKCREDEGLYEKIKQEIKEKTNEKNHVGFWNKT